MVADLDKGRKPATVAAHGFALRRYFSDFLRQKDVVILVPTVESESIPDYLEHYEIQQLLDSCRTPMETVLVTILCDTGLRISELLALPVATSTGNAVFYMLTVRKRRKTGGFQSADNLWTPS